MNRADRAIYRSATRGRDAQSRSRRGGDIQAQDQQLLRKDLGFKMSNAQYQDYLGEEAKFQEEYGIATGKLNEAQGKVDAQNKKLGEAGSQLNSYQKQLDSNKSEINKASNLVNDLSVESVWSEYRGGFGNVHVVSKDGQGGYNTEYTYRLPTEALGKLHDEVFNQEGSYVSNLVGNNLYVDTNTDRGGYGKELHESMIDAENEVKSGFYDANSGRIRKEKQTAISQLNQANARLNEQYSLLSGQRDKLKSAYDDLSGARDTIKGERDQLVFIKDSRQGQRDQARVDYGESVKHRKGLFALKGK